MARFFVCEKCGNLVGVIHSSGVPMVCCGQKMTELVPKSTDTGVEKHLPVVTVEGNVVRVNVGSVTHPMSEEHHIGWIYLETERGGLRRVLAPTDAPVAVFTLDEGERPIAAYAYCNLHGLWKTEIA